MPHRCAAVVKPCSVVYTVRNAGKSEQVRFALTEQLPDLNSEDVEVEVIEHAEAQTERSVARRLALQVLYEVDCAKHPVGEVIAARLTEQPVSRKAERYMRWMVAGVLEYVLELDKMIQKYAPEFPLAQVAIVDRNILRMAVYELGARPNLATGIIIAEAVELANLFGADGASRFVNGVLAGILDHAIEEVQQEIVVEDEEEDA